MSTSRVYTVGQVLTAAQVNDLSQGLLTLSTGSADVGPTSGTTELDVITASAVTLAGSTRRVRLAFQCYGLTGMTAGDVFELRLKEGATTLKAMRVIPAALSMSGAHMATVINPTAGSHTYKVTIVRIAGAGVATVQAATSAMELVVEDIGQV